MENEYNLKGIVCFGDQEYLMQYGSHARSTCPIHPNQTKLAEKLVGTGVMVKFYIRSCPDMRNGGELEDFAILADKESSDRIKAAMDALEGKQLFRGLNDHAKEIVNSWTTKDVIVTLDLSDSIRLYVNERIELGNIDESKKTWLENVCMHWYNEGKNGKT
jgi:hypothetical protein